MVNEYVIVGAGGHARVLLDALELLGARVRGAIDIDPTLHGSRIMGYPIIGDDTALDGFDRRLIYLANGIGSVGSTAARAAVYERLIGQGYRFASIVHPAAIVSRHAALGDGVQILAGAIVQPGTLLGTDCIVNSGAIIEHDCVVGPHSHIASGAILSGQVVLGGGVHVGAGATVRQGIKIGAAAVVGSGAAVVSDVEGGVVVKGVPAR